MGKLCAALTSGTNHWASCPVDPPKAMPMASGPFLHSWPGQQLQG